MSKFQYEIKNNKYKVSEDKKGQYIVYEITEELLPDSRLKGVYRDYLRLLATELDLEYAQAYVNQMFFDEHTSLIDGALINSAIQLLIKCFTNPSGKGRPNLSPQRIFQSFAEEIGKQNYLRQYNQFYAARNTSIVHDQEDYLDNRIGLTVDNENRDLQEITSITNRRKFLYKQNAKIMREMLEIVLKYIEREKAEKEKILLDYFQQIDDLQAAGYEEMSCENMEISNAW